MNNSNFLRLTLLPLSLLIACEGADGPQGPAGPAGNAGGSGQTGPTGPAGQNGLPGQNGQNGQNGTDGRSAIFTDPNLEVEVETASIAPDGRVLVTFRLSDGGGAPLDREGRFTKGTVSMSFVLSWLDVDASGRPLYYTAYTTRTQTAPGGATAEQASADRGGSFEELEPGRYRYTFGTRVTDDEHFDRTHTVAFWATRPMETGGTAVVNGTVHFVPNDPAATPVTREVADEAACDSCHGNLAAHGVARQQIGLCITCHSAQTVDPDTGNTVDFKVMIHKIHSGEHLPSVANGVPYVIIGHNQSEHDYSEVLYPQERNNCTKCHQGADAELWRTRPTAVACLSCHDDVMFSEPTANDPPWMRLHSGGVQPDDAMCNVCHAPTGSIAGVTDFHFVGRLALDAPHVELELTAADPTGPGLSPAIEFTARLDGAPLDILTTPLTTLRAIIAGPNSDFASFSQVTIQGGGASGTLTAIDAAAGRFRYIFPGTTTVPAGATGSWTVGLEGNITVDGIRHPAQSVTRAFAVTDQTASPRRKVVESDRCDNCHRDLAAHGGNRTDPNYCITCHNPMNTASTRSPRFEGVDIWIPTIDFKVMVHKIHAGEHLANGYVLGGFPTPSAGNPAGSPVDFGHVRFPNDLANCEACHEAGTYALPEFGRGLPSLFELRTCIEDPDADADAFCQNPFWVRTSTMTLPPATAACTGCHDTEATAVHAELNTAMGGREACANCHGSGSTWDVEVVHNPR